MMKKVVLILSVLLGTVSNAQQEINVAKLYTTLVFFDSEILGEPILGNDLEFVVKPGNAPFSKRSLKISISDKGKPIAGTETNCIVFTKDGRVYDLNLVLKDKLAQRIIQADTSKAKTNYVKLDEKIPIQSGTSKDFSTSDSVIKEENTEMQEVISNCKMHLNRKSRLIQVLVKSYNVTLILKDIAYEDEKLYLFFSLRNKGRQAYDVEFFNVLKSTNTTKEDLTSQKKVIETYYIHNKPKTIQGKSKHDFVVVMDKTSINEEKAITLAINEDNGDRNLTLNIKDQIINKPVKL